MQIDVFPAYANQKVGAMIMAIAVYRGAPAGVQQLSLSFFSEEVLDEFIREIGAGATRFCEVGQKRCDR